MIVTCPWCSEPILVELLHCSNCGGALPTFREDGPGPVPPLPPRVIPERFRSRVLRERNPARAVLPWTLLFVVFFGSLAIVSGLWILLAIGWLPFLQQLFEVRRARRRIRQEYLEPLTRGDSAPAEIIDIHSATSDAPTDVSLSLPGFRKHITTAAQAFARIGPDLLILVYRFRTATGREITGRAGIPPQLGSLLRPGHRFHVVYLPENPGINTAYPPWP